MNKFTCETIWRRAIAVVLAFFMFISLLPMQTMQVLAETAQHTGVVTIEVKDQNGNPVSGATINYTVEKKSSAASSEAFDTITDSAVTDENGVADILDSSKYLSDSLTVTATITKDGYEMNNTTLASTDITSATENFQVVLAETQSSPEIGDVKIDVLNSSYIAGVQQQLITNITTDQSDVHIEYSVDGKTWTDTVPQEENAGEYFVYVRISKDGYQTYESGELTAKINKINITGIDISPNDLTYNGSDQDLVTLSGEFKQGDTVHWTVNATAVEDPSLAVPQKMAVGKYTVKLEVDRGSNYQIFTKEVVVNIKNATLDLGGLVVKGIDSTYDGTAQQAVTFENKGDYDLKYQLDDGSKKPSDSAWTDQIPTVTDAGQYIVWVKAVKNNYNDTAVTVTPTATNIEYPYNVNIKKAQQSLSFKNEAYNQEDPDSVIELSKQELDAGKAYDFSAVEKKAFEEATITYSIDIENSDMDMGTIDQNTGLLTVTGPGTIAVKAELSGNSNYDGCAIMHTLNIVVPDTNESPDVKWINFEHSSIEYVVGNKTGIPDNKVNYSDSRDCGKISYSIDKADELGLEISDSGKISICHYGKLISAFGTENTLHVTVNATKQASKSKSNHVRYPKDATSYDLVLQLKEIPSAQDMYKIFDVNDMNKALTMPNGDDDWYNSTICIVPVDGYKVVREEDLLKDGMDFSNSVVFGNTIDGIAQNQGINVKRVIYLQNQETGEISQQLITPIDKLDTMKPYNLKLDFPKATEDEGLKYYKNKITVNFTAYDDTSGVKTFHWEYLRSGAASKNNLEADQGDVKAHLDSTDKSGKKYIASITLPKDEIEQLRGNLKISATDAAGNKSDSLTDTGVFVVDTISPTQTVTYQLENKNKTCQTVGENQYFSDDVGFTFKIKEANFNGQDVSICVSKNQGEAVRQELTWSDVGTDDEHEAKLTLSDEAEYVVTMQYSDRSGNVMTSYTSNTIIIDKTKPKIDFEYKDYTNTDTPQTAVVTVTEHNFRKEDIVCKTEAKNISGQTVSGTDLENYLRKCTWKSDGDVHTATIASELKDACYKVTLDYKDLALNTATEVKPNEFIVDRTAPQVSQMSISYSKSIQETILSTLTLGYYNPSVTITFTAHDDTSGINDIIWDYQRQDGASSTNIEKYADKKLDVVQDKMDKTKFTASVTLPEQKAEQLRGNVAFTATDKYQNNSNKVTDTNHVIVVDTIAPTMTTEYTQADNSDKTKDYYKTSLTATFVVTEANFLAEDVAVSIKKNGGSEVAVSPSWKNESTDVHVGTYTIDAATDHSNDGDYVFIVRYKDRSNNKMASYTSNVKVLDTTVPVISVKYLNTSPVNTLKDSQGNERQYFDATNTATISIKEHNFNEKDVNYTILAKDVAGNPLNDDDVCLKSGWTTNGDEHVQTITYKGDANYTFDVSYTDLAKLDANNYNPDYFTVDTTKADDLKITYSESVLDTVLSNISFGFYNAKTKVTITATDHISGVDSFKYSYLNATGVSKKNAELVDHVIDTTGITYSDGGALATATFEIPKGDLAENEQFNGTVDFMATDLSNNESDYLKDTKRIVVDNISPTATVEYNKPTQELNGISYYDGDIKATIVMDEANFYPEDVKISVSKNGANSQVTANWDIGETDIHTGTFTLSQDGDYFVNITYKDKSGNTMQEYSSKQMTIDTQIKDATITINGQDGDHKAYKDAVIPAVSFDDTNFESYEIKLYRTSFSDKDADVTDKFITGHMTKNATGASGTFDTFDKTPENDGIYTLHVEFKDKAGHSSEKNATFTVNRYGSVYAYNNELSSLIQDGGAYVKTVSKDLVITEYNADRLTENSLDIEISQDGKPLNKIDYTVSPEINEAVQVGESGWYQYTYTIRKSNFTSDGVYKVAVSSKDDTGNVPENNNYKDKNILFRVDSTPPEITSVSGLEKNIINATADDVKYTVYDTMGMKSVIVFVNGKQVNDISNFKNDPNNYSGNFDIKESSHLQKVRLLVTDMAGNVTDTDSNKFNSSYVFNHAVTVSTNVFVRWFANKMLFYGSIAGSAVVICGVAGGTMFFRKKRKIL